jgi:hypothetical protein
MTPWGMELATFRLVAQCLNCPSTNAIEYQPTLVLTKRFRIPVMTFIER